MPTTNDRRSMDKEVRRLVGESGKDEGEEEEWDAWKK
jgi:hypothetical protein